MGSTDSQIDDSFPMHKYINKGLTQIQIIKVKQAFDSFDPSDGYIHTSRVKYSAINSSDSHQITKLLAHKRQLNFDQFFLVSSKLIIQKKKSHPDIEIDSNQSIQPTCLFCPYTINVAK